MSADIQAAFPELLWAGTDLSLSVAVSAHQSIQAGILGMPKDQPEEDTPYNFTMVGSVGVISIKGSLVNRDSYLNRYYGVTSYADIRRAMVYAAQKADVKSILLDIDSGGGAVNGVVDTASLIATIDKKVKPVYAFTDGAMASAAYWLGSSARQIYGSSTSLMGSVGVVTVHQEQSKALKDQGIGAKVIRSGKYKMLANAIEPLSQTAEDQLQAQVDAVYSVFIGHVADQRDMSPAMADSKIGQGREFIGESAVSAGLVDGIESFDGILSRINAKLLDNKNLPQNNPGNFKGSSMPSFKQALTEQDIAALAAGAQLTADQAGAADTKGAATAAESVTESTEAKSGEGASTSAAAEVTKQEKESTEVAGDGIAAFLKGELKASQDTVLDLTMKLSKATADVDTMKATHAALVQIAAASLANMKVALGSSAADYSAMSPEALLAEHAATKEAFAKQFRSGGVAAVSPKDAQTQPATVDPLRAAKVAATRF